ncbi:MAG: sensor histidine kinase [Winogradskyella sp.]|uniref:sensor histidine kinase n=1 Tax=Winogradskyella sp. TaxID=1883156 RepID=UPI0017E2EE77|nr:sensor histidine kinase [Winogradskyella sp.]
MGQGELEKSELDLTILIYSMIVMLVLAATIILFFIVFQRRKNKLLLDQIKQQQEFEEELAKSQQEIQEATLKHIGRELHDNVGQLLAFSTMQMNAVLKVVNEDARSKVGSASEALKESLTEVRALSKSLNSDVISNLGFENAVVNEVTRLNKSGLLEANLKVKGDKQDLTNAKDEIILFRILQEFFSNTLKYAEAENLNILLDYGSENLIIKVEDDGNGFDMAVSDQGSGLINMNKRAELINAKFNFSSQPKKGTSLTLTCPYRIN